MHLTSTALLTILLTFLASAGSPPASASSTEFKKCRELLKREATQHSHSGALDLFAGRNPVLHDTPQEKAFVLDRSTQNDLEVDIVFLRLFSGFLSTQAARQVARVWIATPLLEKDAIAKRQTLFHSLAKDTALLNQTQEFFKANQDLLDFFSGSGSYPPEHMRLLREKKRASVFSRFYGPLSLLGLGVGLAFKPIFAFGMYLNLHFAAQNVALLVEESKHQNALIADLKTLLNAVELFGPLLREYKNSPLQGAATLLDIDNPVTGPALRELGVALGRVPQSQAIRNAARALSFNGFYGGPVQDVLVKHTAAIALTLSALVELEVYTGFAQFIRAHPTYTFPDILEQSPHTRIEITNGHHPLILEANQKQSVSNSLTLSDQPAPQEMQIGLMTGPNYRGKSVSLRLLGLHTLFAQLGLPVPAEKMRLTPVGIFTNFRAEDSTASSESLFFAQAKRLGELHDKLALQPRMLVLMDEILTGTSPEEHHAAEKAVLKYLLRARAIGILATHDRSLATLEHEMPHITNIHMSDDDSPDQKYKIQPGPSLLRNAFSVMQEAGAPPEIVDVAEEIYQIENPNLPYKKIP